MNLALHAAASPARTPRTRALAWLARVMTRSLGVTASACLAVVLTACGGGSGNGTDSDNTAVSSTLDASGGAVNGPGGVTVTVPAGALAASTTITIKETSVGAPANLPQGSDQALANSKVYELTPHDVSFAQPVTIRIPIDTSKGAPRVFVSDLDSGWYPHAVSATGDGYVEIQRTGFSWFYVVVPKTTQSELSQALTVLASITTLDIDSAVNLRVGGTASTANSGSTLKDLVYSPGEIQMEASAGVAASARVTTVSRGCDMAQLAMDLRINGQWYPIKQFPAASNTIDRGYLIPARTATFDLAFVPLSVPGEYDMRLRVVCSNFSSAQAAEARLADATWKLRMRIVPSYTVGGTVVGLPTNGSVKLALNGGTPQTVSANGAFTLSTPLPDARAYSVSLSDAPAGYVCGASGGSGSIAAANVSNVAVTCEALPGYHVGGFVSGLPDGASVTLLLNGAGGQAVTNSSGIDGDLVDFVLNQTVAPGSTYAVTVGSVSQAGYGCSVSGGSGTVGAEDVSGVAVNCYPLGPFTIGGNASGLGSGGPYPSVVFSLTSPEGVASSRTVALTGPGDYSLTAVPGGTSYFATIDTSGTGYTCILVGGSGYASANQTNIGISCN